MYKSVVYRGGEFLGEVQIYPQHAQQKGDNCSSKVMDEVLMMKKEIRISHFSEASERCQPLSVLHTITSSGICFKMESKSMLAKESPLWLLYSSCIKDNKTAVMPLGEVELHLVAMSSRNERGHIPCFWGFSVAGGLYSSSLAMLNLRCLGIVFDLDETLIVANTMRSFEDRIDALQRKMSGEVDPQRMSGMLAEIKRYQDDRNMLKQYAESDQVVENGKMIKSQSEAVPALYDNLQPIVRPLIRLPERNMVLTRINPQIRDTSVLVRLRPAWEDLRSYLTARGRKRFEVFVCTMAERDYALEMWRLLDPESILISSKNLLDRIVCVKAGMKKSLFNVFQDKICHPKMSLVIDDRLKVWDEKDQSRVHVVPAFAPYYAPQAEGNNAVLILCVARNVACNVRGGFFKEFDEGLLPRINGISYEDDINSIPPPPDVCDYLASEDDVNVSKEFPSLDGMTDGEVERQLKEIIFASTVPLSSVNNVAASVIGFPHQAAMEFSSSSSSSSNTLAMALPQSLMVPYPLQSQMSLLVKPPGQFAHSDPSAQSSAREEGEVPESELDPDTRRRLLILQHGQDTRDQVPADPSTQFHARASKQALVVPQAHSCGSWASIDGEASPRDVSRTIAREFSLDSLLLNVKDHWSHPHSCAPSKAETSIPPDRILGENQRLRKEVHFRDHRFRLGHAPSHFHSFSEGDHPLNRPSISNRDLNFDVEHVPKEETPVEVLQEIAAKCGTKVEFRSVLVASRDLQFSIEAWFEGEKIGEGTGRTRREAQCLAAEGSIKNLADIYMSRARLDSGHMHGDENEHPNPKENGFLDHLASPRSRQFIKDEFFSFSASESSRLLDPRWDSSKKSTSSVNTLREFCLMEGVGVNYVALTPLSDKSILKAEVHAQVEVDGRVMGNGVGSSWDEAKLQAAENALANLRSMLAHLRPKRQGSPRQTHTTPTKRQKTEFPRVQQRVSSTAARFAKNAPPVI